MGTNSVGTLTAQMIIETEQGEKNLKKLNGVADLTKAKLEDVSDSFDKSSSSSTGAAKSVEKHNEKMGEGEKALRGFYKEQKLQDRTTREAQNAIVGFTMGLVAMTSGMGEGSEGAKKFVSSLGGGIAAMQAAEFAAFGLGTAGAGLTGTFGKVAGALSKYSGVIGAVIGAGVGLYMFFRDTNAEAKKAADEGLKKFNDELDATASKIEILPKAVQEARRQVYQSQLDIVTKELNDLRAEEKKIDDKRNEFARKAVENSANTPTSGAAAAFSILWNDKINKDLVQTEEEQKRVHDLIVSRIARQKELQALVAGTMITAASPMSKGKTEKTTSTQKREDDGTTATEAIKGMAEYGRALYESGRLTKEEYVAQLRLVLARAEGSMEGLEIEKTINALLKDDVKTTEEIIDRTEEQLDQASRIGNLLQQAFSKGGDDFITKLNQALQIAVQIAKITSKDDFGGTGDILEILGTALPFFLSTGTVPAPTEYDTAVMSGIQASTRTSRTTGAIAEYSMNSGAAGLSSEVRAMRSELRSIQTVVNIHNPISLGDGLKVEMPGYNKFQKRKVVS